MNTCLDILLSRILIDFFVLKPAGNRIGNAHDYFNTKLAKICIKSVHFIGLIRARFTGFEKIVCFDLRWYISLSHQ